MTRGQPLLNETLIVVADLPLLYLETLTMYNDGCTLTPLEGWVYSSYQYSTRQHYNGVLTDSPLLQCKGKGPLCVCLYSLPVILITLSENTLWISFGGRWDTKSMYTNTIHILPSKRSQTSPIPHTVHIPDSCQQLSHSWYHQHPMGVHMCTAQDPAGRGSHKHSSTGHIHGVILMIFTMTTLTEECQKAELQLRDWDWRRSIMFGIWGILLWNKFI